MVLVEFFDYQCSACKAEEPVIEALPKADPGVKIIPKEYPLVELGEVPHFGPGSISAAKASYAVDLGNVGNGTPAEVATAAAAVYQVGHVAGEAVSFYGTTDAGNTVIYNWLAQYNTASTVTTAGFTSAVELMGVTDSQVHASWFQ
jgi:hypothetical protein